MANEDVASFLVRIPRPQHEQLREYAERHDRSLASVVRTAVKKLLDEETDTAAHAAEERQSA